MPKTLLLNYLRWQLVIFSKHWSINCRACVNIMPELLKSSSSSFFQSSCARLNPYGHQHHCEKQIPSCIHDKSILLLGHLGACVYYISLFLFAVDVIALLYKLINYLDSFCSNIFYFTLRKMLLLTFCGTYG